MLERSRFLVEHAAVLLAVYNGEQRGGTAATIRYAQKMGRELIVIDPATLAVTHEKTRRDQRDWARDAPKNSCADVQE